MSRNDFVSLLALFAMYFNFAGTAFAVAFVPPWFYGQDDPYRYFAGLAGAIGFVVALVWPHPYRILGLVPPAATVLFVATLLLLLPDPMDGIWIVAAGSGGVGFGAVFRALAGRTVTGREKTVVAVMPVAAILPDMVIQLILLVADRPSAVRWLVFSTHCWIAVLGFAMMAWAWLTLSRPFVELALEAMGRVAYRVRTRGPGVGQIPRTGPCVVIANHAAYLDPLFLAAFIPRPTTPMMTATFYDKPIIRQLMVYVFDTIRVPEVAMKRDTTEVAEAIAALDAGKCLVVFPEGWLRRKEDQPLRRFGRGIWQILAARPDVPVIACWIEGGWGSYLSFKDGPPGTNKRKDFRHPIDVGVSAPERVPAETLADHMATRLHLMEMVAAARRHLGLPDLPPVTPSAGPE